jgi:hypothetical protein
MWGQEKSWPFCVAVSKGDPPKETVSSDEKSVHQRTALCPLTTSDERLLAGGGCVAGGCTPAKPPRSEIIIFLNHLFRQKGLHRRVP